MFGWEFPPHNSGGLGTACLGLTRALAGHGVPVTFVLPRRFDHAPSAVRIMFADAGVVRIEEINSPLYPYITSDFYDERLAARDDRYGRTLFEEVERYARAAKAIARAETFDVIHAHDWLSFPAALQAKRVSGKPLVVHVHATEFDRTGGTGINQEVYRIERNGMHAADAIIAVSERTKRHMAERYGIDPAKVTVVYNGVDREEAANPGEHLTALKRIGKKIVLFAGRITIQKGPEYFIRAAKRVLEHIPDALFLVVGSGDMERQVMTEAAYLGVADKVLFAGFLRGEELRAAYRAADLYVMPSVSEPFGITPLEALTNGTPVLISHQSGVSEVIGHALKSDFWDIDDMADKIIAALRHSSLHSILRENGSREAAALSWSKAAVKCIGLYARVTSPLLAPTTS